MGSIPSEIDSFSSLQTFVACFSPVVHAIIVRMDALAGAEIDNDAHKYSVYDVAGLDYRLYHLINLVTSLRVVC